MRAHPAVLVMPRMALVSTGSIEDGREIHGQSLEMMVKGRCVLVATALAAAGCAQSALVRNGRPEAAIVISATASADEKLAAQELQDYVRKISGATLPVGTTAAAGLPSQVRIGAFGTEAVSACSGERPPPDGFALSRDGETLFIVGGDARGTLYGVYDFLDTDLGVRWFMPGEMGEDIPSSPTVLLPTVSRTGVARRSPPWEASCGRVGRAPRPGNAGCGRR